MTLISKIKQRKFEDVSNDVNVDHHGQDLGLWSLFANIPGTEIPLHSMKNISSGWECIINKSPLATGVSMQLQSQFNLEFPKIPCTLY